jgi:hypothetical protein
LVRHSYKTKESKVRVKSPGLLLRISSFITRRGIVKLTDFLGIVYFSYKRLGCTVCGKPHCYVYWFECVGDCILLDNGVVSPESESLYVKEWQDWR